LKDANSTELSPDTRNPIIDFMPEQMDVQNMGGTMRLGSHEINITPATIAAGIYRSETIRRRHRHRYEFNQKYLDIVAQSGLVMSSHSDSGRRMETLEIPEHRFFFAVQYHAEFSSRPGKPEAAFKAFTRAAAQR